MIPAPGNADFSDPSLFPIHFDPERGEVWLLPITADVVSDCTFLDRSAGGDWAHATRVPWQQLQAPRHPLHPALLFHTAFCGSTLLARTLQSPPDVMSLREPYALMPLAYAAPSQDPAAIDGPLEVVLQLLSRPWTPNGRVLIKPTNQVNNLIHSILRLTRGNAILLYSSLSEFIVSCCKKLPEAESHARWTAQHLLRGSDLLQALDVPWDHPFHFVESCVLAWHAQIEIYSAALANDSDDRLRSLDFARLLDDPSRVVPACAQWLDLGGEPSFWQARAAVEFSRNAKHTERPFDPQKRAEERAALMRRHAALLEAALAWSKEVVAPLARMPSAWKPLTER